MVYQGDSIWGEGEVVLELWKLCVIVHVCAGW